MIDWYKIAKSQHRVLIGLTIFLVIILILFILSNRGITKTMQLKDNKIVELENKIYKLEGEVNERI